MTVEIQKQNKQTNKTDKAYEENPQYSGMF